MGGIASIKGTLAAVLVVGALAGPALAAEVVTGEARTVDADIILVGKQRVILWGIDAPDRDQICTVGKLLWGCWQAAKGALDDLMAGSEVSCELTDEKPDPFGRRWGTCTAGGKDLAAEMVRTGMARAFTPQTDKYLPLEDEAKAAAAGVFQPDANIDLPWEWRAVHSRSPYR